MHVSSVWDSTVTKSVCTFFIIIIPGKFCLKSFLHLTKLFYGSITKPMIDPLFSWRCIRDILFSFNSCNICLWLSWLYDLKEHQVWLLERQFSYRMLVFKVYNLLKIKWSVFVVLYMYPEGLYEHQLIQW